MRHVSGTGILPNRFGGSNDPKKAGAKGGKKSRRKPKVETVMKNKLKKLHKMDWETYQKFMNGKEPMKNIENVAKAILAGEEGMEYFLQQDSALMKAMSDHILDKEELDIMSKIDVLQKRAYFIKNMKDSIYGSKARVENKTELNISAEETTQEISEIYERTKKRFEEHKKSTRDNK